MGLGGVLSTIVGWRMLFLGPLLPLTAVWLASFLVLPGAMAVYTYLGEPLKPRTDSSQTEAISLSQGNAGGRVSGRHPLRLAAPRQRRRAQGGIAAVRLHGGRRAFPCPPLWDIHRVFRDVAHREM